MLPRDFIIAKHTKQITERVALKKKDRIKIVFPFDSRLISKIRELPGAQYHFDWKEPYWSFPLNTHVISCLMSLEFRIKEKLKAWYDSEERKRLGRMEEIEKHLKKSKANQHLYPYQLTGVAFIEAHNGRVLLADEMGLGKTIQSITWVRYRKDLRPVVVVCPASLKLNWEKEIHTWAPRCTAMIIYGRKGRYANRLPKRDFYIINYDILESWSEYLLLLTPQVVILDECQCIKNQKARRTRASSLLCAGVPHLLPLTGTPVVNHPGDMFTVLHLLDKNTFPSWWKFAHRYCAPHHTGWGWDFSGTSHSDELHGILKTMMIRRVKEDVLKDLPPKTRSIVPIEIDNRKEYEKARTDFIRWLQDVRPDKVSSAIRAESFVKLEYLKQLSIQGKMGSIFEWVEQFLENENKLVIFGTHRATIARLKERFGDACVTLTGETTQEDRFNAVKFFQEKDSIRLFAGNIRAAGLGITLTAASNVCIVELGWTPGEHIQAEDRIHRIGQKAEHITAWYLVGKDTIEEDIMRILDKKWKTIRHVIDGVKVERDTQQLWSALMEQQKAKWCH